MNVHTRTGAGCGRRGRLARLALRGGTVAAGFLAACGGGGANDPQASTPAAACAVAPVQIAHSASTANPPHLVVLDPQRYPRARCNDGTPAAYLLRPGSGAAASRWVISLQGGVGCFDQASCASRASGSPQLVGSGPAQADPTSVLVMDGIQDASPSNNPDFYDATQVTALYCSSDEWSGAKAGSGAYDANDVATWSFQGHAILSAVIDDLETRHGLAGASEVLLTGESAGGVGVFVNVNSVAAQLPSSIRFLASSDAGYDNLVYNYSAGSTQADHADTSATPGLGAELLTGMPLWNGSGDAACAAGAATPQAQVACYYGTLLLAPGGSIGLPMFVIEAQQDLAQLLVDGVPIANVVVDTVPLLDALINGIPLVNALLGNFNTAVQAYLGYFAASMRNSLALANAQVSIFSPNAPVHTQADSPSLLDTLYNFPGSGPQTLRQAYAAWYQNPCAPARYIAN